MVPDVPELEVRAAHRADALSLGTFIATAWQEAGPGALGFAGATNESITELAEPETLRRLIAEEDTTILIAISDFVVVGFAAVRPADEGVMELSGIIVAAEQRGRGVGSSLVDEAFGVARRLGFDQMIVRTEPENHPAIRFYEEHGFTHLRHVEHLVDDRHLTVAQLTAPVPSAETVESPHALWDSTCIFCRIVDGEAPASFVYQDDAVVAFMDLYPVTPGHLLVVPREHRPGLRDLPIELGGRMFAVAQILAEALRASELRTDGFNLFLADGEVAMQEVPHAHLHVLPRFPDDGFGIHSNRGATNPTRSHLDRQAAAIRAALD